MTLAVLASGVGGLGSAFADTTPTPTATTAPAPTATPSASPTASPPTRPTAAPKHAAVTTRTAAPTTTPTPTTARTITAAQAVHDPRARIGAFDCLHLQVTITLDNARSTDPVSFRVVHSTKANGGSGASTDDVVAVGAGKGAAQEMPLEDRAENEYRVEDTVTHAVLADSGYQLCDARPRITIGALDCATLSVRVTLDNSRSATATTFEVAGPVSSTEVVPAGRTESHDYRLRNDSSNQLVVSVDELGIFVRSATVFCGAKPKVTIGAFDCTNLVAPVTIDNSGTAGRFSFLVRYGYSFTDFTEDLTPTVEPGQVVVLRIPLGANAYTTIRVNEETVGGADFVDLERRDLCGLAPGLGRVMVGPVSCATGAFDVVVDNRQASPRRAQNSWFVVASTRWGEVDRHAFHRVLEVRRGEEATVRVALSALHGGRLRVTGYPNGYTPGASVIFLGAIHADCQVHGPAPHVPSQPARLPAAAPASSTAGALAATGGPAPALGPLGLLMTGVGLAMSRAARRRWS